MPERLTLLAGLTVTPRQFRMAAYATLAALTLIVFSGAAVRLTDSGLGCENWPKCGGTPLPPLSSHALIEFGNRAGSFVVGILSVGTFLLALRRRPFRRELVWLAALLPLGIVAQAVLGGLTSPGGAVLGGFAVGIIENLAGAFIPYVGRELKLTIALVLIVIVLMFRPSGIFGRRVVSRV